MSLNINQISEEILWEGKKLKFSAWKLAPQADWSVVVRLGDTSLLVTAVMEKKPDQQRFFAFDNRF